MKSTHKNLNHVGLIAGVKTGYRECRLKTHFCFHCIPQFQRHTMLKTPKLSIRLQRYSHFSDAHNNKIQRKLNTFYWLYLKINISEFRLILLDHKFSSIVEKQNGRCYTQRDRGQHFVQNIPLIPVTPTHILAIVSNSLERIGSNSTSFYRGLIKQTRSDVWQITFSFYNTPWLYSLNFPMNML